MRRRNGLTLVLTAFLMTGCYHQVVQTGATPAAGNAVVQKTAALYFFGLVGAEVNTTADCPTGVAIIETQQTFLNGLLFLVTLGIYTPQTVTITCAGGGGDSVPDAPVVTIATDASTAEAETAARRAFELAKRHELVILRDLR